jgi:hypothetical protein
MILRNFQHCGEKAGLSPAFLRPALVAEVISKIRSWGVIVLDLLRDNIWTFVGSAIGIIALFVTVYIFYAQKTRKRLLVQLRSVIPLVSRRADRVPGITVGFNGRPLTSASIFLIRVENIGNTPISPSDFASDLLLTFSEQVEVLTADVHTMEPADLQLAITSHQNFATVQLHLMNPGDYVVIRALVEGAEEDFKASARIVGVKRLDTNPPRKLTNTAFIFVGFCLISLSLWMIPGPTEKSIWSFESKDIPALVVMLIGATTAFLGMTSQIYNLSKSSPEDLLIWVRNR